MARDHTRRWTANVASVGAIWTDGKIYFTSGPGTRKSRNLEHNARCVVSVSLKGLDVVIEGTVARVTDDATLKRRAERYLHAVRPTKAFGVATAEPFGATRWRFDHGRT